MSQRVIVVGAGPGGLAAGIRLAARGLDVTIVEAADRPGGRMRGLTVGPYAFDSGPSIMQLPRLFADLWAAAGRRLEDDVELVRLDPNTRLRFWDQTSLDLTSNLASLKAQLAGLRPDLPEALDRWYIEHLRKEVVGYGPYMSAPVRPLTGYLVPREIAAALPFRPWESLYQHFDRFFKDDRITYALAYPSKYLGMHPSRASSVFSLIAFLELAYGVWHPIGGFRALATAMARLFTNSGGTLHLSTPVQQVWIEQGRVRGVQLADGSRLPGDAVMLNADFGYAVQRLLPAEARGPYTDDRLARMRFSCSTFMLYLGINRRYPHLPHHQIYLSAHVRRRDRPYVDDSALDEHDPPFYVCNPSIVDPGNAPEGHSTIFVLVPIPNTRTPVDWAARRQDYRDLVVSRLPLLGFDGIEQHIVAEQCYTAETWRDDYHVFAGAVFNLNHDWTQIGPLRPGPRQPGVRGLYWVGGATHPGSGLITILESSKNIAALVASELSAE